MISFVIPAHDEADLLGATLRALRAAASATGIAHEIVVVDDASDDATAAIAARQDARVLRVDFRHIAATRNAGGRAARGDVLVFVDADTLVDVALLSAMVDALERGAVGGGATVRLRGRLSWYERIIVATTVALLRIARVAPGCFLFCTRTAFEAIGGFDERYYAGEDVALSRALARRGPFVLLPQTVLTSDRKLRTHPLAAHLGLLLRFLWRGRRLLRSRDALDLWYGARRRGPP